MTHELPAVATGLALSAFTFAAVRAVFAGAGRLGRKQALLVAVLSLGLALATVLLPSGAARWALAPAAWVGAFLFGVYAGRKPQEAP